MDNNRKQALAAALTQIERQFGKGAIMRLGDGTAVPDIQVVSSGSIMLDRVERVHQGGGYGDQDKHPLAWAVAVYVDSQLCRVFNARNAGREWNSIDRLSSWLRDQGFWCWWTRNDLEVVGTATTETEEVHEIPATHFPEPPVPL